MDLRNHGHSEWSFDVSFEAMAADVIETLDAERVKRCWLIGHSLGAKVGMRLVMDFPDRFSGFVLVDIAPKAYAPQYMRDFEAMMELDLNRFSNRRDVDMALSVSIPEYAHRQFLLTNLCRAESGKLEWGANLRAIYRGMDLLTGSPLGPSEAFNGPTLVLVGDRSSYVTAEDFPLLTRHFPNARIELIQRSGHNPHIEQPGAFIQHVREFLSS